MVIFGTEVACANFALYRYNTDVIIQYNLIWLDSNILTVVHIRISFEFGIKMFRWDANN